MEDTGATPAYLWRRAKAVNPKLKVVKVYFKPARNQKFRDQRLTIAKKLLKRSLKERLCDTYLDESTIQICKPPLGTAIGEKGEYIICESPLVVGVGSPNLPPQACGKMSFILAIHPVIGLVHFEFLSNTTKHKMSGRYKVRHHLLLIFLNLFSLLYDQL